MGEVISFAAYRLRGMVESPPPIMPIAVAGSIHASCEEFAAGLNRMRMAARMLSEASSQLRELARER